MLEGSVEVVEAFGSVSGGGGDVVEGFVFPVGPAGGHVLVDVVGDLGDFSGADVGIEAGTEFADEEGNTQLCGIISPVMYFFLMQ